MNQGGNHTDINTSSGNLSMSLNSINDVRINEERNPYQNNNNDQNQTNNNQNQNNNNNNNLQNNPAQQNNREQNNREQNNNVQNNNVQNNNNNPNQNNNLQNNPVQPNNNGFQPVEIRMIRISNPNKDGQCRIFHGDPIKTNNSIAIWYALKTTMHYLRKRAGMHEKKLIEKLDLAAKNNLESISKYLQKCTINNQVTKDIGELAKAFGNIENRRENGNQVQVVSHVNENSISSIVNKYKAPNKSIEDLVLDGLTKEKTKIEDPKDLLAKHDFDDLKETIQTGKQARDEKVFLSKAAKEFQNKVKDLKPVEEGNEQDQARKDYDEAVENLDSAIFDAMKGKLADYQYPAHDNKVDEHEIQEDLDNGTLFKSFGFQKEQQQGKQPSKYIELKADTNYFKGILAKIKSKLIGANNRSRKELAKELNGDDPGISAALSKWDECFNKLEDDDKKSVRDNGMQLKQNQQPEDLNNDLKKISNDKNIEEITLEYDEYNNFVPSKLFYDANDINDAMKDFIETLLLGDPDSKEYKKAKGDLKGMIEYININSKPDTNKDWIHYCSLHEDVDKVKEKDRKCFVPTFIKNLFNTKSDSDRQHLDDNLSTLVEDNTFKTFLSNIMKNDLAVGMIQNNFEQIEKDFKDADYKATRRCKFKEEFWDNNLKGHLPFWGQWKGRVKKNLAMLTGEAAVGLALAKNIAVTFALGTAATWVTIAVTIIAVAVLVSLMIALFKGIGDKMKGESFYEPSSQTRDSKKDTQLASLNKIYTAFLTFGADEEQLKNLVAENNRGDLDKKSPQGKFFNSMVEMKDFLEKNAKKYKETEGLVGEGREGIPFQKLKKILEEKKQPPAQHRNNQNNENINIPQ
ncbi:MAG: hypothetical protein IJU86_01710 [Firmicutes bacterium]|nr:hypothetical protein [Bacillota bacterium]